MENSIQPTTLHSEKSLFPNICGLPLLLFFYEIIELEDSGLPQQGILPNSAKKQ